MAEAIPRSLTAEIKKTPRSGFELGVFFASRGSCRGWEAKASVRGSERQVLWVCVSLRLGVHGGGRRRQTESS